MGPYFETFMKKKIHCYTLNQSPKVMSVLKKKSITVGCKLFVSSPIKNSKILLHGNHQNQNAGLACKIVKNLNFKIAKDASMNLSLLKKIKKKNG